MIFRNLDYERLRITDEGMRAPLNVDRTDAVSSGDGRSVEVEAVEVDEVAELSAIGEDDVRVSIGEGDVGGVGGVGELHVEAVVRPQF